MDQSKNIFGSTIQFNEYKRRAFIFAKSFVHNDEIAEEIALDALLKLWEQMQVEEIFSPKHFLFRIVRNQCLDYLKHQKIHQKLFESLDNWEALDISIRLSSLESLTAEQVLASELESKVIEAINSLPEKTKMVFKLSRFKFMSGKEISNILGITCKGVDYHKSKALQILRVKLKDYLVLLFLFISNQADRY